MNYSESIAFLYGLRLFGAKLGLENTLGLAALCGNPHRRLRFIHVAGTNGKGSTCAMLESVYRQSGLRTGLYTSPHLVSFGERIQVDRAPISPSDVIRWTQFMIDALGGPDLERWPFRPTFFEFVTVLGLLHFAEQRCDLVIWETGLGGRLDATNIVTPLASVITSIGFDHQQWLGNSLEEIASEKAGIIKPGIPVIVAPNPPAVLEIFQRKAAELQAPLVLAEKPGCHLGLSLLGEHQQLNAGVALAVVRQLRPILPVSDDSIALGLASTVWPGRLQLLATPRGRVLLDGAHNPDGVEVLIRALRQHFPGEPLSMVLGFFQDKPWREMLARLLPLACRAWFVPVQSERSIDPAEALRFAREHFPALDCHALPNLAAALDFALGPNLTLVTGSLFFVGEALETLGQTEAPPERELNEWDAARGRHSPIGVNP